jgi:hypothetical protein
MFQKTKPVTDITDRQPKGFKIKKQFCNLKIIRGFRRKPV